MSFIPNPKLKDQIASRLVAALTEIDLRIETEAKKELYVGHGKISGNLQRSIQGEPATIQGNRVRGKVGTKGVKYALPVHRKYKYIHTGVERLRSQAMGIIRKHTKGP